MRKLASIQVIENLEEIEGSDRILQARVLGWSVVVAKKENHKEGDKIVFFEYDSILPDGPAWSEFMRTRHFRVRPQKMRGVVSEGLVLSLSTFPEFKDLEVETDLTEQLNITKYEPALHDGGIHMGMAEGKFPMFVPKTDETRIQGILKVLEELKASPFYISIKIDGTSSTFLYEEDVFHACSRNWKKKDDGKNVYWEMARKYNLEKVLHATPYAIQGEIAGPKMCGNKLRLKEHDLYVFDIFDTYKKEYLGLYDMLKFCEDFKLKSVPIESIVIDIKDFDNSLSAWIKRASGSYESGLPREGIVVRPILPRYSPTLKGRLSFKIINNDYLLKEK